MKNPIRLLRFLKSSAIFMVGLLTVFGIAYRVATVQEERESIDELYPKLEKLVAIHSLMNWKSPDQYGIDIFAEGYEFGSRQIAVCDESFWQKEGNTLPGELFSCFVEEREFLVPEAGEVVVGPALNDSGDWIYTFSWESLFGYTLDISVSGNTSADLGSSPLWQQLDVARTQCESETGDLASCRFMHYDVRISGLQSMDSFSFVVADGYSRFDAQGYVHRVEQWVVYLDDVDGNFEPISLADIKKTTQLMLRELGVADTQLLTAMPALHALWLRRDRDFILGFFSEVSAADDALGIWSKL